MYQYNNVPCNCCIGIAESKKSPNPAEHALVSNVWIWGYFRTVLCMACIIVSIRKNRESKTKLHYAGAALYSGSRALCWQGSNVHVDSDPWARFDYTQCTAFTVSVGKTSLRKTSKGHEQTFKRFLVTCVYCFLFVFFFLFFLSLSWSRQQLDQRWRWHCHLLAAVVMVLITLLAVAAVLILCGQMWQLLTPKSAPAEL